MKRNHRHCLYVLRNLGLGLLPAALLGLSGCSDSATTRPTRTSRTSPVAAPVPDGQMHVYFGDLHLHTAYSMDAASVQTETTPDDAYRFASGKAVTYFGRQVKRKAPLDFLAVTDHAEYLGNVRLAKLGRIKLMGEDWPRLFRNDGGQDMFTFMNRAVAGLYGEDTPGLSSPDFVRDNWQDIIAAAERHYQPGKFTTFVGFEYSASFRGTVRGQMHRNVIFRGPDYPGMPFAATDSLHPEALWSYAEANRARGIDSLMIPHNSNLSNGLAFAFEDTWGKPIDADYARRRAANEPLVEITQAKGTSETRPEISPQDEFADFELMGAPARMTGNADPLAAPAAAGSYVRPALLRGLEISARVGVNPFELGLVGASDYHSGISASEEDNFPGGHGLHDLPRDPKQLVQEIDTFLGARLTTLSASGITGVWAPVNTREAIFDALRRRETFATSGPRIRVRLFGSWGSAEGLLAGADWDRRARAWGVPMGGHLRAAGRNGAAPSFVFQAAKDPLSGNLDRIQIIKLWRDASGSHEKIYDVAWSPGRTQDARTGRLQPVGNTVNAATATYTNTIGATELAGTWTDPAFNPAQQAIYYARVVEIPTPRWDTYLAVRAGVAQPADARLWLQERAWTSPIYYTP
jgi:hypothetical protein